MTIRARIALALGLGLLVAGSIAILLSAVAYEQSVYKRPEQLVDAILGEYGVNRAQATAYLRQHPEAAISADPLSTRTPDGRSLNEVFQAVQRDAQREALKRARVWTAVSMGVLAVCVSGLGWLFAGRILRPIAQIAGRARSASAGDLSSRVALEGPDDELKQLAETFDEMLARLERMFIVQRRFSAQVSHELRTPLSVIRAEIELLLADGTPNPEHLQQLANISSSAMRAERLIEVLLILARSESGNLDHDEISLDELVGGVVGRVVDGDAWRDLRVEIELDAAVVSGDRALLESLVSNLANNAARHNGPGGWVRVSVRADRSNGGNEAILEITNSVAPTVDATGLSSSRAPDADNARDGIGLTVVHAILDAHRGRLVQSTPTSEVVTFQAVLPLSQER